MTTIASAAKPRPAAAIPTFNLGAELNWHLLPLGVRPPLDALEYLRGSAGDGDARAGRAATDFIELLREYTDELEQADVDTGRLLTVFEVNLQSTKKIEQADIVVAVGGGEDSSAPLANELANQR